MHISRRTYAVQWNLGIPTNIFQCKYIYDRVKEYLLYFLIMKSTTVVWLDIFVCISATNPVYYSFFIYVRGVSTVTEETLSPQYSGQRMNSYAISQLQFCIYKTSQCDRSILSNIAFIRKVISLNAIKLTLHYLIIYKVLHRHFIFKKRYIIIRKESQFQSTRVHSDFKLCNCAVAFFFCAIQCQIVQVV